MLKLRAYRLKFRISLVQVYRQAVPTGKMTKGYLMRARDKQLYQQTQPMQKTTRSA